MNIDATQLALIGFFLLIFISYIIASLISIYHLFKFGLSKQTAMISVSVYLISSAIIMVLLLGQTIFIGIS